MKPTSLPFLLLGICVTGLLCVFLLGSNELPRTGPQTEKRFPPLKVPAGFKATLFACDPLIEYPSVLSAGPRPGAIFVAVDYLTGLGAEIVRRDEIRLVEDSDGDGYADKATVFAKGFNSIQGLAYHDRTLYVMHAPFLTALRDTQGTGVADERRDLLTGLGLTPEQNPVRLHCANGVVVGHDGWLYLALGDNGVDVPRPEGDRLVLHGGGILRCRPDGHDLHVFASGLRNIYDVALDADLNVFVRDNENDGGAYMVRVYHSFHGADHGYPYLYEERRDEALPPLADLGRGSSAGGLCYLEQQFPPEYCGNLFFCEWGRSVVRYRPRAAGSSFTPLQEIEFAVAAAQDPYGFKPTDLVMQRDGTLMVSDWADDQRPKRGRGRIYHIAYVGDGPAKATPGPKADLLSPLPQGQSGRGEEAGLERWLAQLASESYYERCEAQAALKRLGREGRQRLTEALVKNHLGMRGRLHAVWALVHLGGSTAIKDLVRLARSDPEPRVRAQAVRAAADLADPVLTRHRLSAGAGDAGLAGQLAELGKGQNSLVLREILIALGRLRWAGIPDWLRQNLGQPDAALAHAAMQALRRSENWPAILKLLDEPNGVPLRTIALRAVAGQFEPRVVDGLIERLRTETTQVRRREYAGALTRVYKMPGPWSYWGYRPPPRPANTVAWTRTEAIATTLDRMLADPDRVVRLATLQRMQREKIPVRLGTLGRWLEVEYHSDRVAAILASLHEQPAAEVRPHVEAVVRDRRHSPANRLAALDLFIQGLDEDKSAPLLTLAQVLEDGPILAQALRRIGKRPHLAAVPLLRNKLKSPEAAVRAAAIEAMGELRVEEGRDLVLPLLQDQDAHVRRAAAGAAGKLEARRAIESLLKLTSDSDSSVRHASLEALRQLREPRAVPPAVAALRDRQLELKALECLAELGGLAQAGAVTELAKRSPSTAVLAAAVRALTTWRDQAGLTAEQRRELDRAVADVHGSNGILVRWDVNGPLSEQVASQVIERSALLPPTKEFNGWRTVFSTGTEARVLLSSKDATKDGLWVAYTEVAVPEPVVVEFSSSSRGSLQVWLNGRSLYRRDQSRNFPMDSDRFAGTLAKGANRLLVEVRPSSLPSHLVGEGRGRGTAVEFQLRFRRKSARAEHERLTQAALTRPGNPHKGRKLFFDMEKSLCLKCHRLGNEGARIGPDLTGVGNRFSRIHIVESILEPSRTIAPSFETLMVTLKNGKVLSGVKIVENETMLTLADNQGQQHVVAKTSIEEKQPSPLSTMPEGLEKHFTEDEFLDLIAFLVGQKEGRLP
jgi:putative membrane-bound dehydrogenase-like protein